MAETEHEELLARFSHGLLEEDARRRLFDAALADQALFDELVAEGALQELLADSGSRLAVVERLRRSSNRQSFAARWRAPLALAASLVIAAAGLLVLRRAPTPPGDSVPKSGQPNQASAALWSEIDSAPRAKADTSSVTARLDVAPAGARVGQELRIEISVEQAADVALLLEPPGGGPRTLHPASGTPTTRLAAGGRLVVPAVLAAPGRHRLRLVALPAEASPPESQDSLRDSVAAGAATIVETELEVAR